MEGYDKDMNMNEVSKLKDIMRERREDLRWSLEEFSRRYLTLGHSEHSTDILSASLYFSHH
jgi:hypothetical protein